MNDNKNRNGDGNGHSYGFYAAEEVHEKIHKMQSQLATFGCQILFLQEELARLTKERDEAIAKLEEKLDIE